MQHLCAVASRAHQSSARVAGVDPPAHVENLPQTGSASGLGPSLMRYLSAAGFRRALEDRLQQRARKTGEPLMRLRKGVAFQRLLARLMLIAPDSWMLKGGLALDF